jgi:hypothetical protein
MEKTNQITTFKVLEICLVFERFPKPFLHPFVGVKTHYSDPFLGTSKFNIIIYIIYFKRMAHLILDINFGFLALQLLFLQKYCYEQIIINLIIYIEGSTCILIICIGIIGPLSHFDYINFKVSLIIKIINFNGI